MKSYHCDCAKYCRGERREVSKTTFFAHKKYRDPLRTRNFLQGFDIAPTLGASSPSTAQDTLKRTVGDPEASSGSLRKRPHLSIDASGHQIDPPAAAPGDSDPPGHDPPPPDPPLPDPPVGNADDVNSVASTGTCNLPPGDVEDPWDLDAIRLDNLRIATEFFKMLQEASLDDPAGGWSREALERLRNLLRDQISDSIDKDMRLAIDLFLNNLFKAPYEWIRRAILRLYPNATLPSYYMVKKLVAKLTGVESVIHDICINGCIAYTGPFLRLDSCPMCSEPRYDRFHLDASAGPGSTTGPPIDPDLLVQPHPSVSDPPAEPSAPPGPGSTTGSPTDPDLLVLRPSVSDLPIEPSAPPRPGSTTAPPLDADVHMHPPTTTAPTREEAVFMSVAQEVRAHETDDTGSGSDCQESLCGGLVRRLHHGDNRRIQLILGHAGQRD